MDKCFFMSDYKEVFQIIVWETENLQWPHRNQQIKLFGFKSFRNPLIQKGDKSLKGVQQKL